MAAELLNHYPKMKKKVPLAKKILFISLTLILILLIIIAYSRYLHPTGEIIAGIYAIKYERNKIPMVNMFLIEADDKYIAIDAGLDNLQTENALNNLGISTEDVIAVFITHSDYDHIGSLNLFKNTPPFIQGI